MKTICPQCNQLSDHTYNGIQSGLPVRDNNTGKLIKDDKGNYVTKSVEQWTCNKCGSTWSLEIK